MILQGNPRTPMSVGFVKWFGGFNKATGKVNEYGFIESIEGDDLFVHASQLGGVEPQSGNFVVFEVDDKSTGKKRALNVSVCSNIETFDTGPLVECLYDVELLQRMLASAVYRDFFRVLINRCDNKWAKDFLNEILPLSKAALYIVGQMVTDRATQNRLLEPLSFDDLEAIDQSFAYVPEGYFDNEHARAILWLQRKTVDARNIFFHHKIDDLSTSFVLACIFEGLIEDSDVLGCHTKNISSFVKQAFQNRFVSSQEATVNNDLLDYVRDTYRRRFKGFDDFSSCSALLPFFELPQIKRKIVSKDRSFVRDLEHSENLHSDPEAFVLSKLIPLIWDGNNDTTVEAAFFHEVWRALLNGQLFIDHPGLMNLFPSCRTLGPKLSCEATFWRKEELFLCRGRRCDEPKVIPDLDKSYLDFNVYDWLCYFGRSYENVGQPSRRDFPIKLAGYFNRLRELRKVLNCRSCDTLMKPDFKYSRVEVMRCDPAIGMIVTEQFSAAYRCTVFYCDNSECPEHGEQIYLNHCLGPKCNKIIDSRDLSKCENGFYRCSCGSCCSEHERVAQKKKTVVVQKAPTFTFKKVQ